MGSSDATLVAFGGDFAYVAHPSRIAIHRASGGETAGRRAADAEAALTHLEQTPGPIVEQLRGYLGAGDTVIDTSYADALEGLDGVETEEAARGVAEGLARGEEVFSSRRTALAAHGRRV